MGGSSLLAHSWCSTIEDKNSIILGVHHRIPLHKNFKTSKIDFSSTKKLKSSIKELNIQILVNCIGYTNIENCEINEKKAFIINSTLPSDLSKICKELSIKFVHISTDHLFDGKDSFYSEKSKINPLNKYADSKSKGEKKILINNQSSLIIRTNFFSWGPYYKESFSDFIFNNLSLNKEIYLFSDVFFTPILVSELVKAINSLIDKECIGIYNVVSNERLSKLDFGHKICEKFKLNKKLINSSFLSDRKDLVDRPLDMSLSNKKLIDEGIYIKPLDKQIEDLYYQYKFDFKLKRNIIPYGRQTISDEDIKSVVRTLKSDFLTQGPAVIEFEKAISKYTESKFSVAVNSATSALHISCMALGLKSGDILWTSAISFVASANCAIYCGAKVDFIDIDKKTYNICLKNLKQKLIDAKKLGRLPKIVMPVHLSGQSCDMKEVFKLSKKYGFKIIEDASHAIGGKYLNEPVGNCKYSDITVFSFHPVKIITTAEGGICTTNCSKLANLLCQHRSHGITRHVDEMTKKPDGPWYYQQINLGYNYRMTDLQASLGISQLKKLDQFINKRHIIAKRYHDAFKNTSLVLPYQSKKSYSSYHLYIIRLEKKVLGLNKLDLFNRLRNAGILVNLHYIPIYHHPYYKKMKFIKNNFLESERYYEEAISIPIYADLKVEDQDYIIENILNFLSKRKTFISKSNFKKKKGFQNIF